MGFSTNRCIISGLIAVTCSTAAIAQQDADLLRRIERQLRQIDSSYRLMIPQDQPISERLLLDYGGSVRFALLGVDNPNGNTRVLRQTDGILYLRAELDGAHRFYGRMRFLYNDFNGRDSFDGRGDELEEPIVDRYWYQFDLRGALLAETGEYKDFNFNAKAGRQFVHWGSGLSLSNVMYAGLFDMEWGSIGFTGLVGLTPSGSTIDFDGSRPGFDSDTDRAYFGGALEFRGLANHRPYVSYLVQRDHNERSYHVFESPFVNFPTRFQYDSEYLAFGSRGTLGPRFVYRAEIVRETGNGLSNPFDSVTGAVIEQTKEKIEAWAGVATLTYLFRDENDTRLDFEFLAGTGDDDRISASDTFGGNASGTIDNSFISLGYVNTGLALAPEVANLLSFRVGWSTSPAFLAKRTGWVRFGINGFLFAKSDEDAPLNVRTTNETFVGGEIDLSLDWRITSDVDINLRYGVFLPGDAIPADLDDPRHFMYAGVNYAF